MGYTKMNTASNLGGERPDASEEQVNALLSSLGLSNAKVLHGI
jgi:hypothetical protein